MDFGKRYKPGSALSFDIHVRLVIASGIYRSIELLVPTRMYACRRRCVIEACALSQFEAKLIYHAVIITKSKRVTTDLSPHVFFLTLTISCPSMIPSLPVTSHYAGLSVVLKDLRLESRSDHSTIRLVRLDEDTAYIRHILVANKWLPVIGVPVKGN